MLVHPLFHWLSKKLAHLPQSSKEWPEHWRKIPHKVYPGAPFFQLSDAPDDPFLRERDLQKLLNMRSTQRDFSSDTFLSEEVLSLFLKLSCGERAGGNGARTYPSGGERYPIEVYLLLQRKCGQLSAGFYHYRFDKHALEQVALLDESQDSFFSYTWAGDAAGAVILTGVFARSTEKYGERGYRYTLLESGHIAQNLYLVGEALGLKVASIGGTYDEKIEEVLGLDGYTEGIVYGVLFG